uniref:U4/U6.U5 tri-snRNP-associated protein 2 n=1 Tax=Rhabditophanes sp. KR3021 TaxID=114890 RepID=A0AC35UG73_9BILA
MSESPTTKRPKLDNGNNSEIDSSDDEAPIIPKRKLPAMVSKECPFLSTINRSLLDFDFEKKCSISLSHINVYACLVCGKYFQGRGIATQAYTHSLEVDHRVFINLSTLKFYCLPDNYEIVDPSLEDIKYVLNPTFTSDLIKKIDGNQRIYRTLSGTPYYPGIVGLNNIKANDYFNVVLHALSHITPIRNHFLIESNYINSLKPPADKLNMLAVRFGEVIRKLWNPKAFKSHVSPHQILQAVVICSNKRFQILEQSDASDFMNFFLNVLHESLSGTSKNNSSIIFKTFRGRMKEYSRKLRSEENMDSNDDEFEEKIKEVPFLCLPLELPPMPLYRDELLNNIIPQVPLVTLLQKYTGKDEREYKTHKENFLKKFEILKLPSYLIIVYKRFQKNQFFKEKNETIINFPIKNVDFHDCLSADSVKTHKYTTYDLLCNIVHEGKPDAAHYNIQLLHEPTGKWFELEDMHVKEILGQTIPLTASYIQVWKMNKNKTREQRLGEDI